MWSDETKMQHSVHKSPFQNKGHSPLKRFGGSLHNHHNVVVVEGLGNTLSLVLEDEGERVNTQLAMDELSKHK